MKLLIRTREWLRGKGRRPGPDEAADGPPLPEFREGERILEPKEYIERDRVIPPEHFPGGGPPQR